MDNQKEIIDLIKSAPAVRPPNDFTARVMKKVMREEGALERGWRMLTAPHISMLDPVRALRRGADLEETGVYFLLAAFAHLGFGAVLLAGFSRIDSTASFSGLVRMQPWASFALAIWLGVWGWLLKRDAGSGGGVGLKGARFAVLAYIEAVVVNGALLLMAFRTFPLLLPFVACIAGGAVIAGVFLAVACRNAGIGTPGRVSGLEASPR